jgi:tRNA pseudouridine55 synthase
MPVEECRAADTTLSDGVLAVNKPAGWTSHDVVAKLRPLFQGLKVGHAGTLDPAATGVLPILIGQATRVAEFLVEWDKEYETVLRLGQVTDTQDATGVILEQHSVTGITLERVRAETARFVGRTMQVPPMYSAVKIAGVPLYRSARAGRTVEREPREVTIHRLDVLGMDGPDIRLRVVCSKGTYIRTLCADLGQALGPGGHAALLVRTRVGPLHLDQARTIDSIVEEREMEKGPVVSLSLDQALNMFAAGTVDEETARRARHGMPVPLRDVTWTQAAVATCGDGGRMVRIHDPQGRILGLGFVAAGSGESGDLDGVVRMRKVFASSRTDS